MPAPLTREVLDLMGCGHPEHVGDRRQPCDEPLYLHSRCHPEHGTRNSYTNGILTIKCRECEAMICQIVVGSRNAPR